MPRDKYSGEIIEEIRDLVCLPDLIQKYTSLNKHGKGLCPFHADHHPSFCVNPDKGLWHCFGCGRGGDVFSFIMQAEDLTFPNAVKLLAFGVGIRLPESDTLKRTLTEKARRREEENGE